MDSTEHVAPDELFWHDGSWYLYKPGPPPEIPPFDFAEDARARQVHRDLLWSMRIAPVPGPLCLVTGV